MTTTSLLKVAPNFNLLNQDNRAQTLSDIRGDSGTFLVFAGNVWEMNCIRNVLWLQRQMYRFSLSGINAVVIVPNQTYELGGFFLTIPRNLPFMMLSDSDASTYRAYEIENAGFVMLDADGKIRKVWRMSEGLVPHFGEIVNCIAE